MYPAHAVRARITNDTSVLEVPVHMASHSGIPALGYKRSSQELITPVVAMWFTGAPHRPRVYPEIGTMTWHASARADACQRPGITADPSLPAAAPN